jgi:hypothetical protein
MQEWQLYITTLPLLRLYLTIQKITSVSLKTFRVRPLRYGSGGGGGVMDALHDATLPLQPEAHNLSARLTVVPRSLVRWTRPLLRFP